MKATDEKIIDHNDYWYIKDNPLSKVGVFPYLGSTISDQLEPDRIYYVLRPEEELNSEETLNSFKLIPIVDDHTMLGTQPGMQPAEEKGVHGTIGSDVYYKDGVIYGDLKIFSETLKEEIENGKKELSMGYFCDYELADGEYNGEPYQAIQRNLRINHVALVDEGRMGADVRVLDHKITFDTIKEIKTMAKKQQKKSLGKSALDEDIEEITKDECGVKDEDVDKRQLIDEVGGMLKDKVDEETWRTIIGKLETLAYNNSEAGEEDEDDLADENKAEDEEEEKPAEDEEEKPAEDEELMVEEPKEDDGAEVVVENGETAVSISLDAMIKQLGQRDALVDAIRPIIGDNKNYKQMTVSQVAKYACDKLDLKVSKGQEVSVIRGYIAGAKKNKVSYSIDNAISLAPAKDLAFDRYMEGK